MKKSLFLMLLCTILTVFTSCGSGEAETIPPQTLPPETTMALEETQPEEDPFAEEDLQAAKGLEYDMQAAFDAVLDRIVEGEALTPAERISNAILHATSYEILSVGEGVCKVKITYPDAYRSFRAACSQLPEDAAEEEQTAVMESFALSMENSEIPMLEETIHVNYVMKENIAIVEWTEQLYIAFSGGFYNALSMDVG